MARRLHPLNALRAFEASARHLSFVGAAEELHVTPAAVSHQVKNLEAYLGVPLLRRLPRGLLLADTGQVLAADLGEAFRRLDAAVDRALEDRSGGALTISVAPMFAVKWLLPRLPSFAVRHPGIDVRMSTGLGLVDFRRDPFDAAIRLGGGRYDGLAADRLFDERVTPMCSPHLLRDRPAPKTADDLRHFVLLHDESMAFDPRSPTWETWLGAAHTSRVDASRGPRFGQPDHALQAAIDGAGVALGWRHLADDDIAAGRLVAPFALELPLGSAFYLVYPDGGADRPKVNAFRTWLLDQITSATD